MTFAENQSSEGSLSSLENGIFGSEEKIGCHEQKKYQTHTALGAAKLPDEEKVCVAGRVVNFRKMGSISFGKLVDQTGEVQFCLNKKETPELYKEWAKSIKIGSIISVEGKMWTSKTGERTALASVSMLVLQNSMHPFPNKVNGIIDPELKLRKRYLDIATDKNVKEVFKTRSAVISTIRKNLEACGFMEVETPILQTRTSGAQAKPFKTRHNAFDTDLYLRIAPETYLKRALAASFDRVFEIGKNFRNEGIDPSHAQEFTLIEWYAAYWTYKDNLEFFQLLLQKILETGGVNKNEKGRTILEYQDKELDFTRPEIRSYAAVFEQYAGVSPWSLSSAKEIDETFKQKVRPNLIQPIYLIDYPAHMSPLAKRGNDDRTVEQWQFIVNGWELVKCYTELTDPILQRKLLEEQMAARKSGDEEAMMLEEDFIEMLEYGCPPASGIGIGVDRLVAILTNQKSLRDVVLFPTLL